jgi:Integrase core domain
MAKSFAERLIGSIRRECLDHVLVLNARHLLRILTCYFSHYHHTRTHFSLSKDAPAGRPFERPELGKVVPIREVGGLHHSIRAASGIVTSSARPGHPHHLAFLSTDCCLHLVWSP